MSVAAMVHFKSPDRQALYVPFATEDVFSHYWLPAAKRHGLQWIPQFEDGASVPLDDLPSVLAEIKQIREFAAGKEILFICKSGQRSALAAEYATAAGLDELPLFNVEGGTTAWVEAGYSTGD